MRPQWFDFADIPFDQMWEDDRIWLPVLLKNQDPFFGRMYFTRKPLEESALDPSKNSSTITAAAEAVASTSSSEIATNLSKTMTATSFTVAQPKNGPFAMFDHHLEHLLPAAPKEIALDGTIATFEN